MAKLLICGCLESGRIPSEYSARNKGTDLAALGGECVRG